MDSMEIRVTKVERGSASAEKLLDFVEHFSWEEVRAHTAKRIRDWEFRGWETPFAALAGERIVGMATISKTDYYPLPQIFPWISTVFVSEAYRGRGISGQLIACANQYALGQGFARTYIPTSHAGLYEQYGYQYLGDIVNYANGVDRLYGKDIPERYDPDSGPLAWEYLYAQVYPGFFGKYFDFSKTGETFGKYRRRFIMLKDGTEETLQFPVFKMAGDCIFNFNEKKAERLRALLGEKEEPKRLRECRLRHHSLENYAFMPITGGMNNCKGRDPFDRPDRHLKTLLNYYGKGDRRIFSNARGNGDALAWYLSLFGSGREAVYNYAERVYLLEDRAFVDRMLDFAERDITAETADAYLELALDFWMERESVIRRFPQPAFGA